MIKMEIKINEEKLQRQRGLSAATVYKKIDAKFLERDIVKQGTGVYVEGEGRDDLSSFCMIMRELRDAKWFYPYIADWIFDVDGEITDVVASYQRIERQGKEAINKRAAI